MKTKEEILSKIPRLQSAQEMTDSEYITVESAMKAMDIYAIAFLRRNAKIIFRAGMDCQEMHPDDDSYDKLFIQKAIKKIKERMK